ncbi:MAG: TIR domain-containing protein [Anaerolineae bacterium]|nr:TIR domain-containing protein [Anaerolineae bacterium]
MHPTANPLGLEPIDSSESHVFMSYSRQDIAFVRRFARDLQVKNVNVWIDKLGLKPGTPDWEQTLRDAIREARAILLVASESSRRSPYVGDELAIARMYGKPIYPVWAAGSEWMEVISMGMGRTQFIDARGDAYAGAVVEAVAAIAGAEGADIAALAATGEIASVGESSEGGASPAPAGETALRNPYKGLRPFRAEDRIDFYGREAFVEALVEDLRRAPGFLAVIGASGSGKSSAVMAGLLPSLKDGALPGSDKWVYLNPFVPGSRPIRALAETIALALPQKPVFTIEEELKHKSTQGLSSLSRQILSARPDLRAVLYVDQFEEVFTQSAGDEERVQFINLISTAAEDPDSRLTLILTMRADFYDEPLRHPALGRLFEAHSRAVLPMSLAELYDVVLKPAVAVGLSFDSGLVGELIFDVRDQAGALPLLQFTLDQLYEQRDGSRLTNQAYEALGRVKGALAGHAEATYTALPDDDHRRLARALFLRLIEPGATEQDTTRRRAALDELRLTDPEATRRLRAVADAFVSARLLITDRSSEVETIEVSHEALIREWDRLGAWLHAAREDVLLQKAVASDAAEWERRGRSADRLYRGTQLGDAQAWAARSTPSALEAAFIAESDAAQERQRRHDEAVARRVQNFQRVILVGVLIILVAVAASIFAGVTAYNATNTQATAEAERLTAQADVAYAQALNQAILADQETAVAQRATALGERDAASTAVALAGATLTPIPLTLEAAVARQAMVEGLGTRVAVDLYSSRSLLLAEQSRQQLDLHNQQNALILAVEAARQHAVASTFESQRALYRAVTYPLYAQQELGGVVVWDERGRQIAQFSGDTLTLLTTPFDAPRAIAIAAGEGVTGAVFSPDGAQIAFWTAAGEVAALAVETGTEIGRMRLNTDGFSILEATFSSDNRRLMILAWNGDMDRLASVWDIAAGSLFDLRSSTISAAPDESVRYAAMSPDGAALAVLVRGAEALRLEVWDIATQKRRAIVPIDPGEGIVLDTFQDDPAIWSPFGQFLWISYTYGSGVLVEAATGEVRYTLPPDADGETGSVTAHAWIEDGKRLLLAADNGARLDMLDTSNGLMLWSTPLDSRGLAFVVSPDGAAALVIGFSQIGRIDLETGARQEDYQANYVLANIAAAAWSPDARRFATLEYDGTVTIWDGAYGSPMLGAGHGAPLGGGFSALDLAWSADGQTVLTRTDTELQPAATLWSDQPASDTVVALPHQCPVETARFSADERWVITASGDQVTLWDLETRQPVWQIDTPPQPFYFARDARFSPDGSRVLVHYDGGLAAYAAADGTRLWSVATANFVSAPAWRPGGDEVLLFTAQSTLDGGGSAQIAILDGATGETRRTLSAEGLALEPGGAAWSPDGGRVLAWMNSPFEPSAWVWDAGSAVLLGSFIFAAPPAGGRGGGGGGGGGLMRCPISGGIGAGPLYSGARWGRDDRTIITWGEDDTLRLWDVAFAGATGAAVFLPPTDGASARSAGEPPGVDERWRTLASTDGAMLSADGSRLVSWGEGFLNVWDIASRASVGSRFYDVGSLMSIDWTPQQTSYMVVQGGAISVYDLATGATRFNIPLEVSGAALSRDEARLMVWGGFSPVGEHGSAVILPTAFGELWRAADGMIAASLTNYERGLLYLP